MIAYLSAVYQHVDLSIVARGSLYASGHLGVGVSGAVYLQRWEMSTFVNRVYRVALSKASQFRESAPEKVGRHAWPRDLVDLLRWLGRTAEH